MYLLECSIFIFEDGLQQATNCTWGRLIALLQEIIGDSLPVKKLNFRDTP